MAESALGPN